jgi:pimeloyl-ACP methyl ester carboxylesterase
MSKIPVYLMPGLAASATIFERIELPSDQFDVYLLDWFLPKSKETLSNYAFRMSKNVKHDNCVLIGVSFGGVLVQEMAKHITVHRIIIISSVKSNAELPLRMKLAKTTKAYKLLPTGLVQDVELLAKFAFGDTLKKKLKLYEKYLLMRNKVYLDWAIEQMVCWERKKVDPSVIHIHGDADEVFPAKNIKKFITVKGGTHAMILSKYRWFNSNLTKIILADSLKLE